MLLTIRARRDTTEYSIGTKSENLYHYNGSKGIRTLPVLR